MILNSISSLTSSRPAFVLVILFTCAIGHANEVTNSTFQSTSFNDNLIHTLQSETNRFPFLIPSLQKAIERNRAWTNAHPPMPMPIPHPPPLAQFNADALNQKFADAEDGGGNSVTPPDAMESWLRREISTTQADLQHTNLDELTRLTLSRQLWDFKERLAEHQAQVQTNLARVELLRTNKALATMDPPDFIGQRLSESIQHFQHEAANPNLPPMLRQTFQTLADNRAKRLADHETNVQLWANVMHARQAPDVEKRAQAERELADYLAANLGQIQGKTYPPGMSLDAILKDYKKSGSGWQMDRRTVVLVVLIVVLVSPVAFFGIYYLRRRKYGAIQTK
jgi:hypothetical protein